VPPPQSGIYSRLDSSNWEESGETGELCKSVNLYRLCDGWVGVLLEIYHKLGLSVGVWERDIGKLGWYRRESLGVVVYDFGWPVEYSKRDMSMRVDTLYCARWNGELKLGCYCWVYWSGGLPGEVNREFRNEFY